MSKNKIRIRRARAEEAEMVEDLWSRCGPVTSCNPPPWDIRFCENTPTAALFVAVSAEDRRCETASISCDPLYVAVDVVCRGSGLGRRLVNHAEDRLGAKGIRKVQPMLRHADLWVKEFSERLGYVPAEVQVLSRVIGDPRMPTLQAG